MGVTAGIFLASILLKLEMRYLVYIRYLWDKPTFIGNINYSALFVYIGILGIVEGICR
jgi:hypothetical protein